MNYDIERRHGFYVGDRVKHADRGEGTVVHADDGYGIAPPTIAVKFDSGTPAYFSDGWFKRYPGRLVHL